MDRAEQQALKEWLASLLPKDMSRNDVADELGVTRRTVSTMLNPNVKSFPGLTMLRYLQLVGAVTEAPESSLASSRLATLEAKVAQLPTTEDLQRGLDVLREAIDSQANPGTNQADARS